MSGFSDVVDFHNARNICHVVIHVVNMAAIYFHAIERVGIYNAGVKQKGRTELICTIYAVCISQIIEKTKRVASPWR